MTLVGPCPHRRVANHHHVQWAAFDTPANSINLLILQPCQDKVLRCDTAGMSRKSRWSLGCQTCWDYIWELRHSWENNTLWIVPKRRVEMRTGFSWLRTVYPQKNGSNCFLSIHVGVTIDHIDDKQLFKNAFDNTELHTHAHVRTLLRTKHLSTKHINTLCGLNVELWMLKLVVHIVTTGI
jgi:hypothetical protein